MRTRSPRIAPPVNGLDGSTASTPTRCPRPRSTRTSSLVSVDLPTPGEPVSPMICAWPVWGARTAATSRQALVAVLDQADQPGDRAVITGPGPLDQRLDVLLHRAVTPGQTGSAGTRMIRASPCPPPPHERGRSGTATAAAQLQGERQHQPRPRHADRVPEGDRAAVDVDDVRADRRAPGWTAMPTDGERLVDLDRGRGRPVLSSALLAARALMAFAGCECSELSGPATLPCATISASQVRPSSSAFARLITTTAHGAVGDRRRRAGGDGAVGAEGRAQLGQRLDRGVGPHALVLGDQHRLAPCAAARRPG